MCIRDSHWIKQVTLAKEQWVWERGTFAIACGNRRRTRRGSTNLYKDKRSDLKTNYGCPGKALACSGLRKAPGGKFVEGWCKRLLLEPNRLGPANRLSVYNTTGMIPAKLVVEQEIRLPGNLVFQSPKTDVYKRQMFNIYKNVNTMQTFLYYVIIRKWERERNECNISGKTVDAV